MEKNELSKYAFLGISGAMRHDRKPSEEYDISRGNAEYECLSFGLDYYFNYVSTLGENPRVLDLGTGKAEAVKGFAVKAELAHIDFYGLGLTHHPELDQNLKPGHFIKSSAEKMKVGSNSIAGVINVMGALTHSLAPELIVSELDRALIHGGVVKFVNRNNCEQDFNLNMLIQQEFLNRNFGCVLLNPDKFLKLKNGEKFNYVTGLALKNKTTKQALQLFKADLEQALKYFSAVYTPSY